MHGAQSLIVDSKCMNNDYRCIRNDGRKSNEEEPKQNTNDLTQKIALKQSMVVIFQGSLSNPATDTNVNHSLTLKNQTYPSY